MKSVPSVDAVVPIFLISSESCFIIGVILVSALLRVKLVMSKIVRKRIFSISCNCKLKSWFYINTEISIIYFFNLPVYIIYQFTSLPPYSLILLLFCQIQIELKKEGTAKDATLHISKVMLPLCLNNWFMHQNDVLTNNKIWYV